MNRYPLWKNLVIALVVLIGAILALPNVFEQNPSIEIAADKGATLDEGRRDFVEAALKEKGLAFKSVSLTGERMLVRFADTTAQDNAKTYLQEKLGDKYILAPTLKPDLPGWLESMGLAPMYLGLDLRGGVHVLIDVDMDAAVKQAVERYSGEVRSFLRKNKVRYRSIRIEGEFVVVKFKDEALRDKAVDLIGNEYRSLTVDDQDRAGEFIIKLGMNKAEQVAVKKFALEQNITTLRNRVNSLGVAEPIIQQQGERRIVVQLPGVQDPAQVKNMLDATATLEYRLVDTEHSVDDALAGRVPVGAKLYRNREGVPYLLKKRVIVTGNQITDAASGFDSRSGQPAVTVNLDGQGARRMRNVTTENVNKPMAVVFIENRSVTKIVDGKPVKRRQKIEEIISVANILEPFGRRFQTTGLDSPAEARDLALLLRAGALAAPIEIVEERTIGPTLGQENIDKGFMSVMVGLALVMIFMAWYYKVFGIVADMALMLNLVLIVAVLSLLQATLTLPGIAGIVLTVGMAVDANVLIFERIREEIRNGSTPQASIHAGYEKAFVTIIDANITTLIAAIVLFGFGTGPIKGFAVTLFIGIITSMFTAILGTRAVINYIYGRKRLEKLAIS